MLEITGQHKPCHCALLLCGSFLDLYSCSLQDRTAQLAEQRACRIDITVVGHVLDRCQLGGGCSASETGSPILPFLRMQLRGICVGEWFECFTNCTSSMHAHTRTHACATHTHTHTCMYAHTCAHTHIHTHCGSYLIPRQPLRSYQGEVQFISQANV